MFRSDGKVSPAPNGPRASLVWRHPEHSQRTTLLCCRAQDAIDWFKCLLLLALMLLQVLALVSESWSSHTAGIFGQSPALGPYKIAGDNDEPYSDRSMVCIRRGRRFKVLSVNEALDSSSTITEDRNGSAVHGYRVVNRSGMVLDRASELSYIKTCNLLNSTLQYMFSVCHTLGYTNLTKDNLRIVNNNTCKRIPNSLPVIMMPYWDNSVTARFSIPAWNGDACIFRLEGLYQGDTREDAKAFMLAVNRTVRESKTVEWLRKPEGEWRNGWYEDREGVRWNAEMVSTDPFNADGIGSRLFDMVAERELDCGVKGKDCPAPTMSGQWGSKIRIFVHVSQANSIAISDGHRFGLFMYQYDITTTITSVRDIGTVLSTMSLIGLLVQWVLSLVALQRGKRKRIGRSHDVSVGCIANASSFTILPLTLLPRLKMILVVFFTVGCEFEGDQRALGESWFIIYPCIVECVLMVNSVINILALVFRRRISSVAVIPTIVVFSLMHWMRVSIGASKWFGFDGRVSTHVFSSELDSLQLREFVTTDVAFRLNGKIRSLFLIKLSLLLLNLAPILFSKNMSRTSELSQSHESCYCELALSVRACNVGGFGLSSIYETHTEMTESGSIKEISMLSAYELVRLGYIVVDDRFLVDWRNWFKLVLASKLRSINAGHNYRIVVMELEAMQAGSEEPMLQHVRSPQYLNVYDPQVIDLKWWNIDARSMQ